MRFLATIFFCLTICSVAAADPAPQPMPWNEVGRIFYTPLQVRMWGPDTLADPQPWTGVYVRVNVDDPYPSPALQPGVWYTADLRPLGIGYEPAGGAWIGADVMFVSGVGIISGGISVEPAIPDFHITFARPDDTTANCKKYIGQTSLGSAAGGGGARSPFSTIVPMTDGHYKFCFTTSTSGNWPSHPSYGINLTVQWWGTRK